MKAINMIKDFFGISKKLNDSKEEVDTKSQNYISNSPIIGIDSTHWHKTGSSDLFISNINSFCSGTQIIGRHAYDSINKKNKNENNSN